MTVGRTHSLVVQRGANEGQVFAIERKQELTLVVLQFDHCHVLLAGRRFASGRVEPVRRRRANLVQSVAGSWMAPPLRGSSRRVPDSSGGPQILS
jgi:hypothetical protein